MLARMTPLLPLLLALAQTPAGTVDAPRDWAATLRQDARALHDDIAANHPGPVNALDPDFAQRNDAALARALERAGQVRDEDGYFAAIRGYAASFDDGHVAVYPVDQSRARPVRWPGFLTGFDTHGAQVVMTREDRAPVPLGARLVACDGRQANRLAAENVGVFTGRWALASRRALTGGGLFADQGNPFITRPSRCTFAVKGVERSVTLDWRPIDPAAYRARLADTNQRARDPIGARTYADGTRWFTLSGFNGAPDGPDGKALRPLIAAMVADRAAIVRAPRIVLDLRGNNGGSSDWSNQVAKILWGAARVDALPDHSYVEWRASGTNLATLRAYQAQFDRPDTSALTKRYFRTLVDGIAAARAAGRPLWREPADIGKDPAAKGVTKAAPPVLPARVYFITDTGCGSACLDAADLWRALGAIQVGQQTGADTLLHGCSRYGFARRRDARGDPDEGLSRARSRLERAAQPGASL
jgi:hypothetical protein